MKAESSRLVPRKLAVNLELLIVVQHVKSQATEYVLAFVGILAYGSTQTVLPLPLLY